MHNHYYNILLILSVIFMTGCQKAIQQNDKADDEREVAEQLIQGAFDHLWAGFDSTKIADYHTDDFFILEQGEIWDNDDIRAWMKGKLESGSTTTRINKMDFIAIDRYDDVIDMAYHNYATFMNADTVVSQVQWLESALAVKTPIGWRLKRMHSTWVPRMEK